MLGIVAGDYCAGCIYIYRLIYTGICISELAPARHVNDNFIPGQNALFHDGVDSRVSITVVVFILRCHCGDDGLFRRSKGPTRSGVIVVDSVASGILTGFRSLHLGGAVTNDGNLPAVFIYSRNILALRNLPSNQAIARTAGRTKGKFSPIGDSIGLLGDRQGILCPEGNLERNLNLFYLIVAASLIDDNHFRWIPLGTYVLVIDITHRIFSVQQDGLIIFVRDCDLWLLESAVVQIGIVRQCNLRRDLLAQDFYVRDQRWPDSVIILGALHLVPDGVISGICPGWNRFGVGTCCACRKQNLYPIAHRHLAQRARCDQRLGTAVENGFCRGRGLRKRVKRVNFFDCQHNRHTDSALKVIHRRETDYHVIRPRVGGQTFGVGGIICTRYFVGILEVAPQTIWVLNIDRYLREC